MKTIIEPLYNVLPFPLLHDVFDFDIKHESLAGTDLRSLSTNTVG